MSSLVLYCIVLCCAVLYCVLVSFIVLYCVMLCCAMLYCVALYWIGLDWIVLCCFSVLRQAIINFGGFLNTLMPFLLGFFLTSCLGRSEPIIIHIPVPRGLLPPTNDMSFSHALHAQFC